MRTLLLSLLLLSCGIPANAKGADEKTIRSMLARQVVQWNAGNIEGYMKGYWESDSLLFIGGKGPRYGFRETLKKYREAYPDKDHMGVLTSVITSIRQLSPGYYFIAGSWALKRNAGDVSGFYTLLLKKIDHNWVIIVDHSS